MASDTLKLNRQKGKEQPSTIEGKQANSDQSHSLAKPIRTSHTKLGKKPVIDSTLSGPISEDVEMCMDAEIAADTRSLASQNQGASNAQNYCSPQVASDSEEEPIGFSGKVSITRQNGTSPGSSTTTLPDVGENRERTQLAEKSSSDVRADAPPDPTDVVDTQQPSLLLGREAKGQYSDYSRGCFSPRSNSSGYYATAGYKSSWAAHYDDDYEYNSHIDSEASSQYKSPPRPRHQSSLKHPQPQKKAAPTPKAPEADARKHRIPPGYSLKNWDPSEEPIMLLGSVFDANSLGKWIYDWTVYHHGPATPIADMAGELWLLLIQLAGKVKRAEECMPWIRATENREMVDDFVESGERLTDKLKKLLKSCETPMLKAGRKHGKELGKKAGTEFVDCIFGRDRQLGSTEQFMASIRLWNLRFDANCEDILREPGQ